MTKQTEIILASNNNGKLEEFKKLFQPYPILMLPQKELNITESEEPFHTFCENALAKARNASYHGKRSALADDSGICAKALNGRPGVLSARFSQEKTSISNNQKLTLVLKNLEDKTVWYYCCLVFVRHHEDPTPIIAEGILHGIWIDDSRGQNGFGYDPHFYLPSLNKTTAELSSEEKNKISHRAQAMNELINKMKNNRLI